MDRACDVQDDMKGLAAQVNAERLPDFVEYRIAWEHAGVQHEIVLRISAKLQEWLEDKSCGCSNNQAQSTKMACNHKTCNCNPSLEQSVALAPKRQRKKIVSFAPNASRAVPEENAGEDKQSLSIVVTRRRRGAESGRVELRLDRNERGRAELVSPNPVNPVNPVKNNHCAPVPLCELYLIAADHASPEPLCRAANFALRAIDRKVLQ